MTLALLADLPSVAEGGSRRPAERRHRHLAPRLLLLRHRAQHGGAHLALRQVGTLDKLDNAMHLPLVVLDRNRFFAETPKPKLANSKNRNTAETEYSAEIGLFRPK